MAWKTEEGIVGDSPGMRALSARIDRVATSKLPVLITGETGTGKELLARASHMRSERSGCFVSENCAALPESLLESELFGHEAGSFTGAVESRPGLFRRADEGTLFIDEVGDMSLGLQAKLLRVLQEGEVRSVGGDRPQRVDVRVVCATHKNLDELVAQGRFRQDLLFRLAVIELQVPPLRERLTDVPALAEHALRQVARESGRRPLALSEAALDRMLAYAWPGNVRELENAVRAGALFSMGDALDVEALPIQPGSTRARVSEPSVDLAVSYEDLLGDLQARERTYIRGTLDRARGNKAEAARRLGITRYALYRTMRRLGIDEGAREAAGSERLETVGV
jgi:DNA-binding NtrC family response regulator